MLEGMLVCADYMILCCVVRCVVGSGCWCGCAGVAGAGVGVGSSHPGSAVQENQECEIYGVCSPKVSQNEFM